MSDQNPYAPPPGGAASPSVGPPADQPPAEPPPLPEPTHQPSHQQPYQPYEQQPYQQQPYEQQPYQQQPYQQQPYEQSAYAAAPPPYPGAGAADDRPTSSLAVVGFIVSLVGLILPVALIGLVLSLVALPGTGSGPGKRKGRGFAIAGAIIGGVVTLLTIIGIILVAAVFSQVDADGDGTWGDEEIEDFFDVESGTDTGNQDEFEDLFENTAVDGAGPASVPADPAALVAA
ncbi:MAG: DUF4190 domain-containing protein [Kineosporiaceae bacterium]